MPMQYAFAMSFHLPPPWPQDDPQHQPLPPAEPDDQPPTLPEGDPPPHVPPEHFGRARSLKQRHHPARRRPWHRFAK